MKERLEKLLFAGRKVEIEVPEINYETPTGVLIEWNRQSAWLPKDRIQITSDNGTIKIKVPKWLFERKFS
ncbi:MAG: hypothetical protein R3C41_22055 [Calditrichia bacterium]|nr:hypothetical protein [Calditrichota bacterium]MCB0269515.1 hypothetical protein [Calditrichota bacterium]MCB0285381.1 hypothetical protein [Calditrichota bacterium]MCB9067864.1 hypothetical protein [Calditrichia bacterium]